MSSKKTRKAPCEVDYHGIKVRVGTYKKNKRVDISYYYMDKKSKKMKLFCREYVPVTPSDAPPLIIGEYLPDPVLQLTLDKKIVQQFLPALLETVPWMETENYQFALLGPYCFEKMCKAATLTRSIKERQIKTLNLMITQWGEKTIEELVPSACANDLLSMSPSTAEQCLALLRKLYPSMTHNPDNVQIWKKYKMQGRKKTPSSIHQVRTQLLNTPPSPGQIVAIIKQCVDAIFQDNDAAEHLAALMILCLGLIAEEVCALMANTFLPLSEYPGHFGLLVSKILKEQTPTTKKTCCESKKGKAKRVRKKRHTSEDLSGAERRLLGVGNLVVYCWQKYQHLHPEFSGESLLLSNPRNKGQRILSPNDFRQWLNKRFECFIPDDRLTIDGKTISSTYDIEALLRTGAMYLLKDRSEYNAEELRYHWGQEPAAMDGKHYVGFKAPSEIVSMGVMQSMAIQSLVGGIPHQGNSISGKKCLIPGAPEQISIIRVTIDINKLVSLGFNNDMLFRMMAHGFHFRMTIGKRDKIT